MMTMNNNNNNNNNSNNHNQQGVVDDDANSNLAAASIDIGGIESVEWKKKKKACAPGSSSAAMVCCSTTTNILMILALAALVIAIIAIALALSVTRPEQQATAVSLTPEKTPNYLFAGTGQWTTSKPSMPYSKSDFPAVNYDTALVIMPGGYDANGEVLSSVLLYDTIREVYNETAFPEMPRKRFRHAATIVDDTLFVLGGFNASTDEAEPLACVDTLNLRTRVWTACSTTLNVARGDVCAASTIDGTIVVAGGYGLGYETLTSTETLARNAGEWKVRTNMPEPRGDTACAAIGQSFYVVGGFYDPTGTWQAASFSRDTFRYDVTSNQWDRRAATTHSSGDKAVVALPKSETRPMGRLLAIGGETHARGEVTQIPIHAVEEYLPEVDTWVPRAPMPTARFRFGAVVSGSKSEGGAGEAVHVFGGHVLCSTGWFNNWEDMDCMEKSLATQEVLYQESHPAVFIA